MLRVYGVLGVPLKVGIVATIPMLAKTLQAGNRCQNAVLVKTCGAVFSIVKVCRYLYIKA